ncbi:hypothetical protein D3C85_539620 [compost metagenome]
MNTVSPFPANGYGTERCSTIGISYLLRYQKSNVLSMLFIKLKKLVMKICIIIFQYYRDDFPNTYLHKMIVGCYALYILNSKIKF